MSKKHLNTRTISNELAGGASLFFMKPSSLPQIELSKESTIPSMEKILHKYGESIDLDQEPMKPSLHEINLRGWKDLIENTETHNSSLRLTNEENYAVEDVVNDLKRSMKVKTSLNEVARLGLLYIIRDFEINREKSLIYKVKKA